MFRQLAQFTGARCVFLTYGADGRATGGATDIDQRDYEELSLDERAAASPAWTRACDQVGSPRMGERIDRDV